MKLRTTNRQEKGQQQNVQRKGLERGKLCIFLVQFSFPL